MLHNTGPYGPNETPVNMPSSVNVTPTGHMNIVSNINHLAKLGHGNTPTPSGSYGLGDYAVYHHQHYNMPPQMPQFPNHQYQHLGFQHNFANSGTPQDNYQNNMLPMNLNIHNDSSDVHNYHYDKRPEMVRPDIVKERKIPLNIPQIPNKSLAKQGLFDNDYVNNSFHNPNHNLDLSMKPQDRLPLTNSRRKKIENTVKLIENILINSANLPKETLTNSVYNTPNEMPYNKTEVSLNPVSVLPKTSTVTEPITDSLSLTIENVQEETNRDGESIIKSPVDYSNDKSDNIDTEEEHSQQSSDIEDVKPAAMLEVPCDDSIATQEKSIEIKIEKASWTDSDFVQPFFRDCNAFQRDEMLDCRIIDGDTSINEAKTAILNDIKLDDCFECPHCGLLFKNPKRFLIHAKWHAFGLTNEKRTELMRAKEERKNQRREAKIIERMNAKDVTDKDVSGKTWPCKDCDKVFSAKGSLKNHRQRLHPSRIRECKVCHKSLVGWIALRNHMATHAGEAGVGFQCSECPKRFKYAHSLAKHSDTHLEKVHACQECPKKFGSQALLKMHMKTHERHSRGATFRCTYCAKGFFESYSLQVHERTHRNERPFLCEICNTSYGTNSSLKRHLKVSHSSSKPFECSVCHRSFSTEPIRDRHELRLHGKPEDFKYPCKQCSCKYAKLKDLQKHVYKAHPKNKRKKKVKSDTEPMDEDSE